MAALVEFQWMLVRRLNLSFGVEAG